MALSELVTDERAFVALIQAPGERVNRKEALVQEAAAQSRAYFAKRLARFDLPLALHGTALENDAWGAVAALETGMLVSYADIARAIGRPRSHRGVARAMSRTPLDLFIPAHRVLGADGTIKGDALQTAMRRRLLEFEGFRVLASGRVERQKGAR